MIYKCFLSQKPTNKYIDQVFLLYPNPQESTKNSTENNWVALFSPEMYDKKCLGKLAKGQSYEISFLLIRLKFKLYYHLRQQSIYDIDIEGGCSDFYWKFVTFGLFHIWAILIIIDFLKFFTDH